VGPVPSLTFEILGSLVIRRGDEVVSLGSPLQRKVLAALLVADRAVLPDELIDVLWGERPPATASGTLQTHISRLRSALGAGPDLLRGDVGGYRLQIDDAAVDARRFGQLVAEGSSSAQAGLSERARALLTDALALWRGPALLDFRYEPFAQTEITRLEGLRLSALVEHLGLEVDGGMHAEANRELEVLVRDHPLHEELHALYMVALYRSGRQADALEAYERLRVCLRDELGLDPTPQLRALEHDILTHAPTLASGSRERIALRSEDHESLRAPVLQRWFDQLDVPALDDKMTCELLLARGDGQRRSGKVREARRSYSAAVRLAATSGSADQLAAGALGLAGPPEDTMLGEPLDESLMTLAIRALPENPAVLTMLRARLAVALIDRGEADRGNQMADAAVTVGRSVGDGASLAYALRARHRTWFDPAALGERLALSRELVGLGERLDDREVAAWGHRWQVIDLFETGDLAACERELDALEALATQLHDAFHWWGVVVRRAGLALLTGPPDKAEPLVMEALGLADQIHSPYTLTATLNTLWALRWQQGRLDEIQDAVRDIAALSPTHAFLVPLLHRELDQPDEAAGAFDALARDGFRGLLALDTIGSSRLYCLAALSDVATYLGAAEHAPMLYDALAPFADHLAVIHPGLTAVAPIDQPLGQLCALMGERARSEEHFEAAIARCGDIGAPTLDARARTAYAEALLGFGDAPARDRAEGLLTDAADLAAQLGVRPAARRQASWRNS
jgi:DNA-binding SARP family transcriptional activator